MPQNQEQDFIKEKIKDKPLNKKKLLQKGIETIVFAVLFGFVSCLVFYMVKPTMEKWFTTEPKQFIEIPGDTLPDDTQTEANDSYAGDTDNIDTIADTKANEEEPAAASDGEETTADEKEKPQEQTSADDTKPEEPEIPEMQPLDISSYQELQNELYQLGTESGRFMVTVTGITDGEGLFDTISETTGQASGVIIAQNSKELLVLTDYKIIADVKEIQVMFVNHDVVKAKLKQYDANTHIAILSIPVKQISDVTMRRIETAVLGNSLMVRQGRIVIALGTLLGNSDTVLTGNVTSISEIASMQDWNRTVFITNIVSDGRENGVLVNTEGEVVGLLCHISGLPQNVMTAVSISELKEIIERLSNGQEIPYFGIVGSTITDAISEEYEVPKGVYIKEAVMDSPAMAAGLQNGDVIVEIDGREILTMDDYQRSLMKLTPGDRVEIIANRQNGDEYREYRCTVEAGILK